MSPRTPSESQVSPGIRTAATQASATLRSFRLTVSFQPREEHARPSRVQGSITITEFANLVPMTAAGSLQVAFEWGFDAAHTINDVGNSIIEAARIESGVKLDPRIAKAALYSFAMDVGRELSANRAKARRRRGEAAQALEDDHVDQ